MHIKFYCHFFFYYRENRRSGTHILFKMVNKSFSLLNTLSDFGEIRCKNFLHNAVGHLKISMKGGAVKAVLFFMGVNEMALTCVP